MSGGEASGRRRSKSATAAREATAAGAEALGDQVEQLRESVAGARAAAVDTAQGAAAALREQLDARPYLTLGACAATGYVLAGGLTPAVMRLAVKHGGRLLVGRLLRELTGEQG